MKKFILPLLLVLSLSMLIAVESEASDVVGYFKKSIASGGWDAIGLPFNYPVGSMSPSDILGDQFGDFDQMIDMGDLSNSIYIDGAGWVGLIDQMAYGKGYWVNVSDMNPDTEFFILGKVTPSPVTIFVAGDESNNWSAFSLNEAKPVSLLDLNITGAMDFDTITDITSLDNAIYIDGVGWVGLLEYIEPTHVYWYNSSSPVDFTWDYIPGGGTRQELGANSKTKATKK